MKIHSNKPSILLLLIVNLCIGLSGHTQTLSQEVMTGCDDHGRKEYRKAWEIGVGMNGMQMTRFDVIGFHTNPQGGYTIDTNKKDLIFGGHLYLARELNSHFYLDFQGMLDYSSDPVSNGHKSRWVSMAGLGFQWRMGEYLHSQYIDPFFRVGVNYMYKNFRVNYKGMESHDLEQMKWNLSNNYNKEGNDKGHLIPLSVGAGVNMWLNDHAGIGLQAEYLFMPYRQVADSWNGTIRLMWRIGGKSKKPKTQVRFVEKIVERIVEKPVVTEKIVQVQVPLQKEFLGELVNYIYFEFNKAELSAESAETIDKIAQIMKNDKQKMYLIIGCTDAKGSPLYNMELSAKRAKAVLEALIERGVPGKMLKARGIGEKISYVPENSSDNIRKGDRKIIIETITNMDYWNYIP